MHEMTINLQNVYCKKTLKKNIVQLYNYFPKRCFILIIRSLTVLKCISRHDLRLLIDHTVNKSIIYLRHSAIKNLMLCFRFNYSVFKMVSSIHIFHIFLIVHLLLIQVQCFFFLNYMTSQFLSNLYYYRGRNM